MRTFKIQMYVNHLKTVMILPCHNLDDVSDIDNVGDIDDAGSFVGSGFMGKDDYAVNEFSF